MAVFRSPSHTPEVTIQLNIVNMKALHYLAPVGLIPEENVLQIIITRIFVSLWIQSKVVILSIIVNLRRTHVV